jgi:amino acid transporter
VLFTVLVLAPFLVMSVLGSSRVETDHWFARAAVIDWPLLLSSLLWNTSGWDNAGCIAGEVNSPARNYHRAMVVAVVLVTAAYLLPVAVGVSADTGWSQWQEGHFPKIAAQVGGPWLSNWLSIAGLISALGLFNALLCTSSRVPYAMAQQTMLPRALAGLHPRHKTPVNSIVVNAVGAALLLPFSFQELIQVDMFLYALALLLEFAALIWLRIKAPGMPRPYRIPLRLPGVIALSLPPMALCLASIVLSNAATKCVALSGILLGLGWYFWQTRQGLAQGAGVAPSP